MLPGYWQLKAKYRIYFFILWMIKLSFHDFQVVLGEKEIKFIFNLVIYYFCMKQKEESKVDFRY
mgnify:FL=1